MTTDGSVGPYPTLEALRDRVAELEVQRRHLQERNALLSNEISSAEQQAREAGSRASRLAAERHVEDLRATLQSTLDSIASVTATLAVMRVDLVGKSSPSEQIIAVAHEIGLERGTNLALRMLYARWFSLSTDKPSPQWKKIGRSRNILDDLVEIFSVIFPAEFAVDELDLYEGTASKLVELVSSVGNSEPSSTRWLLAWTFESVLAQSFGREAGVWETPSSVADLVIRLVCQANCAVLDPACGTANMLVSAAWESRLSAATAIEINPDLAVRAWMRLRMAGLQPDVRVGDAFEQLGRLGRFDAVVAQPPWGKAMNKARRERLDKIVSNQDVISAFERSDLVWLLLAYAALRPGGRAAVVLPLASTNSVINRTAHRYLLDQNVIEAIVSFPEGGLFQHTEVGAALWLLHRSAPQISHRDSILMIDSESMITQPDSRIPKLTGQASREIRTIVERWREFGRVDAASHVARAVDRTSDSLRAGLHPAQFLADPPHEVVSIPEPPGRLLTALVLKNFKSFAGTTRVPLAPLTVIFGANSAGKSTIIQSLLLLKQSIDGDRLITQGNEIDLGKFSGIVHHHRPGSSVGLGIEYGTLNSWIPTSGTPDPSKLREVYFKFAEEAAVSGSLEEMSFRFDDHATEVHVEHGTGGFRVGIPQLSTFFAANDVRRLLFPPAVTKELGVGRKNGKTGERVASILSRIAGGISNHLTLPSAGLLPSGDLSITRRQLRTLTAADERIVVPYLRVLGQAIGGVAHELRQLLESVVYIGPLRSRPQRFYNRAASLTHPGDAHHIAMYLFDHSNLVKEVNEWLDTLDVAYSLDVVPVVARGKAEALVGDLVALSLTDRRSSVVVSPADVGFGISQVLPIVVELLARRESIVCIEQPETHLHPRLQTRLADLLIAATRKSDRANQVIVETHSEHLMLRLQRRVREGNLDPNDISILYVDQTTAGESRLHHLALDKDGGFIDEWPDGFFDERLEELFGSHG